MAEPPDGGRSPESFTKEGLKAIQATQDQLKEMLGNVVPNQFMDFFGRKSPDDAGNIKVVEKAPETELPESVEAVAAEVADAETAGGVDTDTTEAAAELSPEAAAKAAWMAKQGDGQEASSGETAAEKAKREYEEMEEEMERMEMDAEMEGARVVMQGGMLGVAAAIWAVAPVLRSRARSAVQQAAAKVSTLQGSILTMDSHLRTTQRVRERLTSSWSPCERSTSRGGQTGWQSPGLGRRKQSGRTRIWSHSTPWAVRS